jgi:hypothetical protein
LKKIRTDSSNGIRFFWQKNNMELEFRWERGKGETVSWEMSSIEIPLTVTNKNKLSV